MSVPLHTFDAFAHNLLRGVYHFDAAGAVTAALCAAAHAPAAADAVRADLTEVDYAGLSGRVVAGVTAARAGDATRLTGADLVLRASADVGPFRYVVLYDAATPAGHLIGWYDYGEDVTLHEGEALTVGLAGGILDLR